MRETYDCAAQWQGEREPDNEIVTFEDNFPNVVNMYMRRIGVILTVLISLLCGTIGLIIGALIPIAILLSLPALLVFTAVLIVLIVIVRLTYRR